MKLSVMTLFLFSAALWPQISQAQPDQKTFKIKVMDQITHDPIENARITMSSHFSSGETENSDEKGEAYVQIYLVNPENSNPDNPNPCALEIGANGYRLFSTRFNYRELPWSNSDVSFQGMIVRSGKKRFDIYLERSRDWHEFYQNEGKSKEQEPIPESPTPQSSNDTYPKQGTENPKNNSIALLSFRAGAFFDDFEMNWTAISGHHTVIWVGGDHGNVLQVISEQTTNGSTILKSGAWNYAIWEYDIKGGPNSNDRNVRIRWQDESNSYSVNFRGDDGNLWVARKYHGQDTYLATINCPINNGTWYHVRIETLNDRFKVYLDNVLKVDVYDHNSPALEGTISLESFAYPPPGGWSNYFDNISVK